jgi:DNA-binding transcriptional MerR regulator
MNLKNFPEKLFYKIGEVAKMVDVEPYVLRYWETEFNIKLSKSKNKQRLYQRKDIDQVEKIKRLLYDERFTIEGAKKKLRERKKTKNSEDHQLKLDLKDSVTPKKLLEIKQEIENLLKNLKIQ